MYVTIILYINLLNLFNFFFASQSFKYLIYNIYTKHILKLIFILYFISAKDEIESEDNLSSDNASEEEPELASEEEENEEESPIKVIF